MSYATGPYDPNNVQQEWEYEMTLGQKVNLYALKVWQGFRVGVDLVFRGIWSFAWRWWR